MGATIADSEVGWNPLTHREKINEQLNTRESLKDIFLLKSCVPFTRAARPPFIGRWSDFYILIIPSDLKNIPSGNTYKNVLSHPQFVGPTSDIINLPCIQTLTSKLQRHAIDSVRLGLPFLLHWSMRIKIPDFGSMYLASQTSFPNCRFPPKFLLSWNRSQNLKNTRHFSEYFSRRSPDN
jgi:hypothetical protein